MKIIVGIGNPGEKYRNNRHNVGFVVLEELARQMVNGQWSMVKKFNSLVISHQSSVIFAKPQTFMNSSGIAVKKLVNQYKIKTSDLWVIHDDLDIRLGGYKIQFGKAPKQHKGLESIDRELGRGDYWHVRIGVDNRMTNDKWPMPNAKKIPGEVYVLQDFSDTEMKMVNQVVKKVVNEIQSLFIRH